VHFVRHQADEVAQAEGRFENASVCKAQTFQQRVDRANDERGGVVGVEGGGAGGFEFVGREQLFESLPLLLPLVVPCVEDLWQATPANEPHQDALFRVGRRPAFGFEPLEQFDGGKVVQVLALE